MKTFNGYTLRKGDKNWYRRAYKIDHEYPVPGQLFICNGDQYCCCLTSRLDNVVFCYAVKICE